ncbi:DUF4382 domain-containing protein [Haloplanus vescus]|uniref:DUF4382 domain-containing protein n=1 Tax=Haloplanus vescus TaxID=555874 RepID=UPI0024819890|nr:DUF4382 domain-containing protein [Haloplanus vescus]
MTALAGCSGGGGDGGASGGSDGDTDDSGGGSDGGSGALGAFRLLISDQPAAIEDFESLDVTLSSARVFRAEEGEEVTSAAVTGTASTVTEESDDEDDSRGVVEFDLDDVTVDLTQVVGDRAVSVLEGELEAGRYSGIELRVASAEGVVDGESVDVMVPSDRLRIVRPFEVAADTELEFVFDINVVRKGQSGEYNLLPVIGKSGVAGEDVDVEEVDGNESAGTATGTANATATPTANATDTSN